MKKEKGSKMKQDEKKGKARAEDVKICEICGKMIVGECDYVRTRRKTMLYFCKGMKCRRKEENE